MRKVYVKAEEDWEAWQAGEAALPLLVPGGLLAEQAATPTVAVDVVLLGSVWFGQSPRVMGSIPLAHWVAHGRFVQLTPDLYNVGQAGRHKDDALYLLDSVNTRPPARVELDHAYILGWAPYLRQLPAIIQE